MPCFRVWSWKGLELDCSVSQPLVQQGLIVLIHAQLLWKRNGFGWVDVRSHRYEFVRERLLSTSKRGRAGTRQWSKKRTCIDYKPSLSHYDTA